MVEQKYKLYWLLNVADKPSRWHSRSLLYIEMIRSLTADADKRQRSISLGIHPTQSLTPSAPTLEGRFSVFGLEKVKTYIF